MKIQITEYDIDDGEQCQSSLCPLALAILRTFKADVVGVGIRDGYYVIGDTKKYFSIPVNTQDWTLEFDMYGRESVSPVELDIHIEESI